jgi:hypothetical protein
MKTPIDKVLYEGKYLYVLYSKEDEHITFSFPKTIDKKEWREFKKELEAVIRIELNKDI